MHVHIKTSLYNSTLTFCYAQFNKHNKFLAIVIIFEDNLASFDNPGALILARKEQYKLLLQLK